MDGLTDHRPIMEGEPEYAAVYAKIQSQESFHRMKFDESVMSVMADIFEEPVVPLPQTIGRIAFPRDNARGTHPHQDWIFVRGSTETLSPGPAGRRAAGSWRTEDPGRQPQVRIP